jgi:MSHA biogenesis protein MshO
MPVKGYFDTVRRARITDEADTTLRFIARELHAALPNSITCGTSGSNKTLSFLPILSGGRYREYATSTGSGTAMQFNTAITGFDAVGGTGDATLKDAHGQAVSSGTAAIGNLGSGVSTCDATQGTPQNTVSVTSLAGGTVTLTSDTVPLACDLQTASASNANDRIAGRFYMTSAKVTYSCGASGMTRNSTTLSSRVSACQISCDATRNVAVQTISLQLTLTDSGESVTLFRQIHVENYP